MLRTAFAALGFVCASYAGASWLTHDFQVWTAEGARRLEVALQPVSAPAVLVEGPGLPAQPLQDWLGSPGRVTLVDLIYTRCETVCLSLGGVFQQLQRRLEVGDWGAGAGGTAVRLLSISFDPVHDTPERLGEYAKKMNANPALWQFARVPAADASADLLERFGVVVVPDDRGGYEHNAAILVLNGQGQLVRIFDISEQELAFNYAQHLASRELAAKAYAPSSAHSLLAKKRLTP